MATQGLLAGRLRVAGVRARLAAGGRGERRGRAELGALRAGAGHEHRAPARGSGACKRAPNGDT